MKKIILYFIITTIYTSAQSQDHNRNIITGSWININITDYYDSNKEYPCDIKYFDNDKFMSLYLSFENKNQLKITFRIEQKIFTYNVIQSNPDSIIIYKGKNVFRIYLIKDLLRLQYHNNLIIFKKVSNTYSSDVLGEFIKDIIFKNYKNYIIASFTETKDYNNKVFNRYNLLMTLKEIFQCKEVEIVQLGSLKYGKSCLPEIALYYSEGSKFKSPRVLGILIENGIIKFVDNLGVPILTIKSNYRRDLL